MTRFMKVKKLEIFRQHQNTGTIFKKKNIGQNRSKKLSKCKKLLCLGQTREKQIVYGLM